MFDRSILKELRLWSQKKERKPLVLRGARQVGKTSAVVMFSNEFDTFIHLNLEKPEHRNIFESGQPFEDLLTRLFFHFGVQRYEGKTLIFLDEIQNSARAVSLLRYFHEEAKDLFVIAAGSLLESILDRHIAFPVGRVEFMVMHPCTFNEFLAATGEDVSLAVYNQNEIPAYAHEKLLLLFKKYSLIGGMPEVVSHYADYRDITALPVIHKNLLLSFVEDVEKYSHSDAMRRYIRHIISVAFREPVTRITFEKFGNSSYKSREMKEAFQILEKTMLLKLVYPVTSAKLPLLYNLRKKPRLHLIDTGLVNHALGVGEEIVANNFLDDVYRGIIAEHIVGQELHGINHLPEEWPGFWVREKKESDAETDYIFPYKGMLIPVEVKSGPGGTLRSLHQYVKESPHQWSVRIYSGGFSVEEARTVERKRFVLINIPIYMTGKIQAVLDMVIKN